MRAHPVRRRTVLATAAATPALATLGCTSGGDGGGGYLRQQVTFATSFGQFGRDAYPYVAREQGFFDEEGIEVEIVPGTGTTGNLELLLADQAQFVVFDLAGFLASEQPHNRVDQLSTLAMVHQRSLVSLMSGTVAHPMDLHGRRVGIAAGTVTEHLLPAWAPLAGVDLDQVDVEPMSPSELIPAFAAGRIDAVDQFVVGRPTVEHAAEGPVNVLPFADQLDDLYGVALFTRQDLVDQQPSLCRRFRRALLRGLAHALDHPRHAAQTLAEHNTAVDRDTAAEELRIMDPYVRPPGVELGAVDMNRLARMVATMQGAGATRRWVAPDDIVAQV